jgi:hypothetical protein
VAQRVHEQSTKDAAGDEDGRAEDRDDQENSQFIVHPLPLLCSIFLNSERMKSIITESVWLRLSENWDDAWHAHAQHSAVTWATSIASMPSKTALTFISRSCM